MTNRAHYEVAIAGGGIVGAACALACARRGLRVALIERNWFGGGATSAGMGHVVVLDDSEAQFALTRYSQQLWHDFALRLPPSAEYEERGTLWIAADASEMDFAERMHAWFTARSVPCQLMNAAEIAKAEPNLARNLTGGLLVPQDAIVIPSVAALAMAEQAQELGAVWMLGKSVREFGYQSLLLNDGGELRADRIVNALGVDSIELSPDIPIRKRKGHLAITDRYPGFIQHQLVELGYMKSADITTADSVAFNVQPRRSGQLLVGSSRQFGSEDTVIDQHILSAMLARASLYLPGLSKLDTLRAWTGFRAATPDKLPLIGPDPTNTSLLLATGHEGLGITASLATAELIADYVCKQKSVIPAEPYLPARFLNNTPYKT